MALDLVVKGGLVVDGTGAAPYRADVGVTGGRIVEIGRITDGARQTIDAEGHVVSPGFVDGHTHMDAQVMWDPFGTCSSWHGVTTVVMGNCGFTLAPALKDARELVVRNLERAEDISAEAMAEGIDWSWESFGEYLDAVERRPKGINYSGYVGHSALRTWAMGERAFSEEAGEADLERMVSGLKASLRAGAVGFTTSRSDNHETSDDRPVASRLASWGEVSRLVGTMGSMGGGVFELALEPAAGSADPQERSDFLDRLRDLSVQSGATVTFGVLPVRADGEDWRHQLASLDECWSRGGRMVGQSHSRGINGVLSFRTKMPFDKLTEWAAIRALPLDQQRRALEDPEVRRRLVQAAQEGPYGRAIGAEVRPPNYKIMQVLLRGLPPNPTVDEMAAQRGVDPVDLIIDLALATDFDQLFVQPFAAVDDEALLAIMRHPRTVMTFSDSGAHVSQILDSSIQTHLLGHWVRDRQAFRLEEAVRMITSVPAAVWGFSDRGVIAEGMAADLNVFDADQIGPELPRVVNDLPGGASRLVQKSAGIRATIVAGEPILTDGELTGALPGRLLRGPLASGAQS